MPKYRKSRRRMMEPVSREEDIIDFTKDDNEEFLLIRLDNEYLEKVRDLVNEREDFTVKGSWTKQEDSLLMELVSKFGPRRWTKIAMYIRGRQGKQCRERWKNHLDPELNHSEWTEEEDNLIISLHSQYDNGWAKIAKFLKGRTPNRVKNRWNSNLCKRDDIDERIEEGVIRPLVFGDGPEKRDGQGTNNIGHEENDEMGMDVTRSNFSTEDGVPQNLNEKRKRKSKEEIEKDLMERENEDDDINMSENVNIVKRRRPKKKERKEMSRRSNGGMRRKSNDVEDDGDVVMRSRNDDKVANIVQFKHIPLQFSSCPQQAIYDSRMTN